MRLFDLMEEQMKKIIFFLIFLACQISIYAQVPLFSFSEIQFGLSEEEVLASLEDVEGGAVFRGFCHISDLTAWLGVGSLFEEGLYIDNYSGDYTLNKEIISEKNVVFMFTETNIKSLRFFFVPTNNDDSSLFMVVKNLEPISMNIRIEFDSMLNEINKSLNIEGEVYHVKYDYIGFSGTGYVGLWRTDEALILLLIYDVDGLGRSSNPILVFRNNKLWEVYIDLIAEYEEKIKREAEDKAEGRF